MIKKKVSFALKGFVMAFPIIKTALPKRRYQFGEFLLVVLGDIETEDKIPYRFLLSILPEGAEKPELFISSEPLPAQKNYQMRIIAENISQTVSHQSDQWGELDLFCQDALALVSQLLNLGDERPVLLT